jgi:hypothetical protein
LDRERQHDGYRHQPAEHILLLKTQPEAEEQKRRVDRHDRDKRDPADVVDQPRQQKNPYTF